MSHPALRQPTTYHAHALQVRAYRRLKTYFLLALERIGISGMEWVTLGLLYDSHPQGLRITELAKLLDARKPFATATVKRLELTGLIKKAPKGKDQRVRVVTLTPRGAAAVPRYEAEIRQHMRSALKGIPRQKLDDYVEVLTVFSQLPAPPSDSDPTLVPGSKKRQSGRR